MPTFGVCWNASLTASAILGSLFGTADTSVAIAEFTVGADASGDRAVAYALNISTGRGTPTTSITPVPLGEEVTQAAVSTFDTAWSVTPVTTGAYFFRWAVQQRTTYRWVAVNYRRMPRTIVGAGRGVLLQVRAVTASFNAVFGLVFHE